MKMVKAKEGGLVRKSEKKPRVVPPPDEIAKSGEKGAHLASSPAPAGEGGGSRWSLPPAGGGGGRWCCPPENLGRPIAQLQQPPW